MEVLDRALRVITSANTIENGRGCASTRVGPPRSFRSSRSSVARCRERGTPPRCPAAAETKLCTVSWAICDRYLIVVSPL